MTHKHKWVKTMWHLVNPYGCSNETNTYLDVEICRTCGVIRVSNGSLIGWEDK